MPDLELTEQVTLAAMIKLAPYILLTEYIFFTVYNHDAFGEGVWSFIVPAAVYIYAIPLVSQVFVIDSLQKP